MSAKHNNQESLNGFISSIAQNIANSSSLTRDAPVLLLNLKERLAKESQSFSSKTLEEVYVRMWKSDIIHVLIEVLREDFSPVDGQWRTASELSSLLAKICSFIRPQRPAKPDASSTLSLESFSDEELEEYYDILLPTAIDSLLIVANNIHENDSQPDDSVISSLALVNLEHFKLVLSSLCRVCSAHLQCISRIIQSPYLLHLLVTDHRLYATRVLNVLHELISQKEERILLTEELQSLLDELVFKIGGTDKDLAMSSLSLLALLSSNNGAVLNLICDKYKGLSILLQKWSDSFDGPIKSFAQTLLERVMVSDEDYRQCKAAVIIQAGWKGYCTRKKLLKAKQGIIKFQRLYRKRKAKKIKEDIGRGSSKSAKILDSIHRIQSARQRHEREKEILERMSAMSIESFLLQQEKAAVTRIQSWWRGIREKKDVESNRLDQIRERSAVTIQRSYRRYKRKKEDLQQQNGHLSLADSFLVLSPRYSLPPLTVTEREQLEAELPAFIDEAKTETVDDKELFGLLDWFYRSREEAREADRKQAFLLTQLSKQCEQLLSMPSLSSSSKDTFRACLSNSGPIQVMAERAHKEELACLELPWWKRPTTSEELEL